MGRDLSTVITHVDVTGYRNGGIVRHRTDHAELTPTGLGVLRERLLT